MSRFNADGYLAAGFHDMAVEQIEAELVRPFSASISRPLIFDGYLRHRLELETLGIPVDQFINGSFATNKINPGDIDLVCFVLESDLDQLSALDWQRLQMLTRGKATRATHLCDAYLCTVVPQSHPSFAQARARRKYWMGEFGFDREDRPKGIVRTTINGGTRP